MDTKAQRQWTKIGSRYHRTIGRLIPEYAIFSLLSCFAWNMIVYVGNQLFKDRTYYDFTTGFDRKVPFVPQWILIYLICFGFWIVNYILIGREGKEKCYRFVTADLLSRAVCGVFFLLMPTTNVRPEVIGNSFSEQLVRMVYQIDRPVNLFPSIHCLVSWFCYIGIRGSKKIPKWYQHFSMVFALLVCLSTQFTKQHYIIDLVGGILLAELCFYFAFHTNTYRGVRYLFEKLQHTVFGKELEGP